MRLYRNYVKYHFIFPKINKRGVGIRAGGLKSFSKIDKRGDDYSVLESMQIRGGNLLFDTIVAASVAQPQVSHCTKSSNSKVHLLGTQTEM